LLRAQELTAKQLLLAVCCLGNCDGRTEAEGPEIATQSGLVEDIALDFDTCLG